MSSFLVVSSIHVGRRGGFVGAGGSTTQCLAVECGFTSFLIVVVVVGCVDIRRVWDVIRSSIPSLMVRNNCFRCLCVVVVPFSALVVIVVVVVAVAPPAMFVDDDDDDDDDMAWWFDDMILDNTVVRC